MRLFSVIILSLTLLLLAGCNSNAPQAMLEEYSQRMSNVLDTELAAITLPALPAFPQKRDRVLPTTEIRQGLWEVLDFRQCDMLAIISERNSSLGKVMLPSQKMRYEIRFLSALQDCRDKLSSIESPDENQQAFQSKLDEIYQIKRSNLPLEIWNGIYASDEMSKHFKLAAPPFSLDASTDINDSSLDSSNVHRALEKFSHLASLAETYKIELPDWLNNIETDYAALHHSDYGSRIISSMRLLTSNLNQVAEMIEARLKAKAFCFPNHQPPPATVLNNVFRKYYVQQVQPYMALLEREAKPWFEQHNTIMQRLPKTKAMQDYSYAVISMQQPNSLWQQWISARNRHTKAWQTILTQCKMMPRL